MKDRLDILIDLVTRLKDSSEQEKCRNIHIETVILEIIKNKNRQLKEINFKLDYIKTQNLEILERVKYLENLKEIKLQNKKPKQIELSVYNIVNRLEEKTRDLETIALENIRVVKNN